MSDIVERAEDVLAELRDKEAGVRADARVYGILLLPEIVAALKAAQADNWALVEEKQELRDKLKAARTENQRLQNRWDEAHAGLEECDRNDLLYRLARRHGGWK